ncbi:putative Transcription regulator, TetR-like [Vibrio nigripulchritudo MADA3029]|uniref:Transcription regulator, TetR-like n=1 Tax=Vibrio nigripulchritudo SOn1 TaxID=1238450 RepID=A0AAV2VZ10_9VIBR|nr:TetR/AcrR family transcriptional regulator [Vibrio nigripulchritudo]EGU54505.1 TetR family transcripitonal regulator [Vibrio nigripulchritudo ATCC 27043]KJY76853.1 TetR family transcriptional regulator [Vibrio nigripulchritudo]CCN45901.1 putative Transcription regulator, TetR-like [Vibrio nigripulchritudo MADA3020]CCN56048.1 putative Transcription regulator, TetR-like [Vibrio nigripulchritudo MADA3021]CCN59791.1 putative Transcription regulator, TetR-like [Vibrio nigripulchritudo MADA3029]
MPRKSNFDKQEKLIEAMTLFWEKGYANTSVADLVDTLGINRFSLYNTYGDKQALYYSALDFYLDNISFPSMKSLLEEDADLITIEEFLTRFASIQKDQKSGCFLQNALIEHGGTDDMVKNRGEGVFDLLLSNFEKALINAQSKGQIDDKSDAKALASLLLTQVQGVRVLGKAKAYDQLEMAVKSLFLLLKAYKI